MSVEETSNFDRRDIENTSIDELRKEYVELKATQFLQRSEEELLNTRIEMLREESVRLQQSTEIEEEHVANQLLRRLNDAERGVRKYEQLIHEEEEAIEHLTHKISEICVQQMEVENELQKHQEQHIMLQGKLLDTGLKKSELGHELLNEWQRYLTVLVNQLAALRDTDGKIKDNDSYSLPSGAISQTLSKLEKSLPPEGEKSIPSGTAVAVVNPKLANTESLDSPLLKCDCSLVEGSDEKCVNNLAVRDSVVRVEQRLNRLLEEHAEALRITEEMKRRYSELLKRLKSIQDIAFIEIVQAAKYREDLQTAQAKLLEFNPRNEFR